MGIGLVVSSLEDVICNWGCRGLPDRPSPQILYCHVLKFSWLFAFNVSPARKLSSSSSPLPNVPFFKVQALPLLRLLLASLPSVPRLLIMAHKNSKPEKKSDNCFLYKWKLRPREVKGGLADTTQQISNRARARTWAFWLFLRYFFLTFLGDRPQVLRDKLINSGQTFVCARLLFGFIYSFIPF